VSPGPPDGGPADGPAGVPAGAPPPGLDALAATFGLDPEDAQEIRAASRHVVRFPASRVLTVAGPDGLDGPRREVAMAGLLADAGVPATRCLAGPALIDGWAVTAWREVAPVDPAAEVAPATLGALAARFHRSTSGLDPRGITLCDPVGAALAQVAVAVEVGATGEGELAVLRSQATRLEDVWRDAAEAMGGADAATTGAGADHLRAGAVVHGDLHAGNAIVGRDGPVAIDLELAGWGPRAYDAAPTVAGTRWYGRPPSDRAAFDTAYGAPLTEVARDQGLDEVWALWATAWAVANRHRSPEAEAEAAVRVATLATGAAPRPWRLR